MSPDERNGGAPDLEGTGLPIPANEWREVAASLKLSPREVQIAEMLVLDIPEAGIAMRLGISPHTVHTHTERIFRKLGVRSRVQLANRVIAASRVGRLWVRTSSPDSLARFDVYERSGALVGTLAAPYTFVRWVPPVVRGDQFYAVVLDELDVPYVIRARIASTDPGKN